MHLEDVVFHNMVTSYMAMQQGFFLLPLKSIDFNIHQLILLL